MTNNINNNNNQMKEGVKSPCGCLLGGGRRERQRRDGICIYLRGWTAIDNNGDTHFGTLQHVEVEQVWLRPVKKSGTFYINAGSVKCYTETHILLPPPQNLRNNRTYLLIFSPLYNKLTSMRRHHRHCHNYLSDKPA